MIKIEVGHLLFQRKIRQEENFALRAKKFFRTSRETNRNFSPFLDRSRRGGPPLGRIYALEKLGRI